MEFRERLKALRNRIKMTQEELALRCGLAGQSTVGNYESSGENAREPELAMLPKLADALGVPTGALVDDRDYRKLLADPDASRWAESEKRRRTEERKLGIKDIDPELAELIFAQMRRVTPPKGLTRKDLFSRVYDRVDIMKKRPSAQTILRLIQDAIKATTVSSG